MQLCFKTLQIGDWLRNVTEYSTKPPNSKYTLNFEAINDVELRNLRPLHIVSLACLIEKLIHQKSCQVDIKRCPIGDHLIKSLRFQYYWGAKGNENFVNAEDEHALNLWRVVDTEKEIHSQRIHDYLKNTFFKNKDLSVVKESLVEIYYNIFDHAYADGNAFSFIKYDKIKEKLYVAVCDFGIGIAQSVRNKETYIQTDADALSKAMEFEYTTQSQKRNRGVGLCNIKDACTEKDYLRIFSNNGFLIVNREVIVPRETNIAFCGTLISYELSLAHFEEEEIIDNFVW